MIVPDHDAHVFNPPLWSCSNGSFLDKCLDKFFSGLRRWDGIYFLHIARFGYTYENCLAFFPTYPLLFIRPLAIVLSQYVIDCNAYLLSAIFVNFVLGFINVYLLFELAIKYRLKYSHAYLISILYMINPATVFFLAPYSETLFFTSQLLGHYFLQSDRVFSATIFFAFGSSIRSNGMISAGFIVYHYLKKSFQQGRIFVPLHYFSLCLISFILTQIYLYRQFCFKQDLSPELITYGNENQLKMPLTNFSSSWCSNRFPSSYQYVQSTHWNVGPFRYWQWKQIPNFLLAMPIFIFLFQIFKKWFGIVREGFSKEKFNYFFIDKKCEEENYDCLKMKTFLPHLVYTLFLSLFALVFMHIQVTTRFLFSSGPLLYVLFAARIEQHNVKTGNLKTLISVLKSDAFVFFYFLIYLFVGICLFSNFLPWT